MSFFPERDYERDEIKRSRIEEVEEEEQEDKEEVREKKDGELSSITKYYDHHHRFQKKERERERV